MEGGEVISFFFQHFSEFYLISFAPFFPLSGSYFAVALDGNERRVRLEPSGNGKKNNVSALMGSQKYTAGLYSL